MVWTVIYSEATVSYSITITTCGNDYNEALLEAEHRKPLHSSVFAILKGSHTDTVRFY